MVLLLFAVLPPARAEYFMNCSIKIQTNLDELTLILLGITESTVFRGYDQMGGGKGWLEVLVVRNSREFPEIDGTSACD